MRFCRRTRKVAWCFSAALVFGYNDLLTANIKPFFTTLCDVQVDRFRRSRVLLGSRLIAFFRVDRTWTEQYLLPLFSWNNPAEAKAVWEGFL
jgi:hypothetical protein